MKKILSLIFIIGILLSLTSCGDGYKSCVEGNVSLRIPETLEKRNVNYADVYYSNGEMYLMMQSFSNSEIKDELLLYEYITVEDYVLLFQAWNGYSATTYYNEERDCVHFSEVTTTKTEYSESSDYEYFLFFRREGGIIAVYFGCDAELKDKYQSVFEYMDSTVAVK